MISTEVPVDFRVEAKHKKDSLGDLDVNRWQADDGRVLELLYFAGFPKQDRGPMVIAKKEAIEVVGQKTTLIETNVFFGATRKVFAVYFRFGDAIYIVVAERMRKSEFTAVLHGMKRSEIRP